MSHQSQSLEKREELDISTQSPYKVTLNTTGDGYIQWSDSMAAKTGNKAAVVYLWGLLETDKNDSTKWIVRHAIVFD